MDPGKPTGISPTTDTPVWGSSFGAMGSGPPPVLLQKGTFTSTADLPLAPYVPATHSRRHLHALQRRSLLTLGDLSHAPPGAPRSWLPADTLAVILPFDLPPMPPYPPDHHPPPRAGQFWVMKGTADTWGGIYQLLSVGYGDLPVHSVQRWAPSGRRPSLGPLPRVGQRLCPLGRPTALRAATLAAHAFSRLIVHSSGAATSGTVLAALLDRLLPPPDPPPSWTDIFKEHLDPQQRWRIYTDGSWRAALPPTSHDYFLEPGGMQGGGCIVVTQDSADWATTPIYVLPFTVPSMAEEYGGIPMNMELLAISAGLELLDDLGLQGTVFSDCQGLVQKLLHPQVLRRTPASAGFPLIRACVRRLHPSRTLQWVRSHPERSRIPRTAWDQSQWGIFFADRYARSPFAPPEPGFPLQIAEPISFICIAEGAIRPDDWHWATAGHAPLLGALGRTVSAVSLTAYLSHRDNSRALRGAPPLWAGTSSRYAARIWTLGQRGIARRGRKARHLWDLRWHGENQAIADPANGAVLSRCGLCAHPTCGLDHILCECPNLSHLRDSVRSDLVLFAARQQSASVSRLMHRYVQLLFTHPVPEQRGHLWLGHWPPSLRLALGPLLSSLTLREGQAALLRLGAYVTQAYGVLWDGYGDALRAATPPSSAIDYAAAPLSSPPSDSPATPAFESPISQLATPPWTVRLDADHG